MCKKRRRTSNQRDDTFRPRAPRRRRAAGRPNAPRALYDYYRQQLGLDDDEWRRMMATFRKPLPATFASRPDGPR